MAMNAPNDPTGRTSPCHSSLPAGRGGSLRLSVRVATGLTPRPAQAPLLLGSAQVRRRDRSWIEVGRLVAQRGRQLLVFTCPISRSIGPERPRLPEVAASRWSPPRRPPGIRSAIRCLSAHRAAPVFDEPPRRRPGFRARRRCGICRLFFSTLVHVDHTFWEGRRPTPPHPGRPATGKPQLPPPGRPASSRRRPKTRPLPALRGPAPRGREAIGGIV